MGVWDVAMNVEGADVERRLGRSLMPRFHAAFSLGTVAGATLGAVSAAAGLPLAVQLIAIGSVVPVAALLTVREFIAVTPAHEVPSGSGSGAATAWRERRTLIVGLLVLAFAFTEGTANDWIAVALVDGYGASEAIGARLLRRLRRGDDRREALRRSCARPLRSRRRPALDRHDRPRRPLARRARRHGCVALAGAALWGIGASLGFPVGMSAAADDPARAPARVSVVASIGYTAFLAGPPLIGLLADSAGILRALLVAVAALGLGLIAAGAARPLSPAPARSS